MPTQQKPKWTQLKAILTLIAITLVLGLVVFLIVNWSSNRAERDVRVHPLPGTYNDSLSVFGDSVLYYDGQNIRCLSATGSIQWDFPIGANADFHASNDYVAAWSGSTLYIINKNGKSTYNDNLGEKIQFARIGKQYVAAVVGDVTTSRIIVKDHMGAHMDEESVAYDGLIILDTNFYGEHGEYMWSLALDVFATASNTILNTYEVGRMNTGTSPLGEYVAYHVVFADSKLKVLTTRNIFTFNERGVLEESLNKLVYGWRLIDNAVSSRNEELLLLAPATQIDANYELRQLRLLSGEDDKRYDLPNVCVGGILYNSHVYAFSSDQLLRAGQRDSHFDTYDIPLDLPITRVIGTLTNGYALVACGSEIYTVSLPKASTSLLP